ncbi:MAG TPA: sigma-70 family RNA polymerase sigma factor [Tepidisphaeraceae bacterium]|jgi:RNA polymerase sigma-70 factor (ECF subfamily)|nr:sigma-70 family RNA polymerase sigma factor [Tepidisphaeraceae bacterium]
MSDSDNLYLRLLVIRCQAGDPVALEELIAMHQPRLRSFLHKMHFSHADDLLQDVWIDVFHGLPRLADPASFVPWLYRIARNRVYRKLRRPDLFPLDTLDPPADESAEENTFTSEDAAAVHVALDKLSPEHREVLLLRFMEEMSYDDIARVTNCNLGTIRSRIHNAKRHLKSIIEQENQP